MQAAHASEDTNHDNAAHDVETHSTGTTGSGEHAAEGHHGGGGEHHAAPGSSYHPPGHYKLNIGPGTVHIDTLLGSWMVMIFLTVVGIMATRNLQKKPDRKQVFFEGIVDFAHWIVKSQVAKDTARYVPLIGSIFVFVWIGNWLGLLPWRALELIPGMPHGFEIASPTNDLNTTAALAIISLCSYWYFGLRKKGLSHFKHYLQPIWWLAPLNAMEDITRPLSLSFRLFGNIIGGEIVLGILIFLTAPLVITSLVVLPLMALEIFIGMVQAFIFAILTASYIGGVVAEHH